MHTSKKNKESVSTNSKSFYDRMLNGKDLEAFVRVLANCTPSVQKAILHSASDNLVKVLCNCCSNGVFNPSITFTPSEKAKLRRYQKLILKLAHPKVSLKQKKKHFEKKCKIFECAFT